MKYDYEKYYKTMGYGCTCVYVLWNYNLNFVCK